MSGTSIPKRTPVLWINGPEAVGKSTVAFAIFRQLSDAGTKSAFVDLDQVNLCYPAPENDPFNYGVRAAGLAAVWATFREEGVRCFVVSGIAESKETVMAHMEFTSDLQFTVVRLRATPDELRSRFIGRGGDAPHADETVRWADKMDRSLIGDLCVNTDGLTSDQTADLVRAIAGDWPCLT